MNQADKRTTRRNRTLRAGKVIFNGGFSVLSCSVRNISEGGAMIEMSGMIGIPREFELKVDAAPPRPCRVAWRNDNRIGVEFIAALSAPSAPPKPSLVHDHGPIEETEVVTLSPPAAEASVVEPAAPAEPQTRTKRALTGLWPPVATPFRDDGTLDTRRLVKHSRRLLAEGAHGLAVLGTTSEATSLTLDERRRVIDAHMEAGIDPSQLLPGTGACALDDAATLTRHAGEAGAAAVLMLPPFYYKTVTNEGIYGFVARVIEKAGPKVPRILLYHIPPVAVVGWSQDLVGKLLAAFPGVVVGMKDSSGNFEHTVAMIKAFPGFVVFPGAETNLVKAMDAGAGGCISATANINAVGIRAVFDRWMERDASRLQTEANAVRSALEKSTMIPGLKAILAARYSDPAWANVRAPLTALSPGARNDLFSEPAIAPFLEPLVG